MSEFFPVETFVTGAITVQRCRNEDTQTTFIRKRAALRDIHACNILRHEYHMLRRVHVQGDAANVTRPLELREVDSFSALHTADIHGRNVWRMGERLDNDAVINVARQACDALIAVHKAGVLHCDLNPRNLVRNGDGHVELIDFDLARPTPCGADATHWRAGAFVQGFAAPEQTEHFDAPLGVWTDLYGLGATLYALLTGAPPFTGKKILEAAALRPATAVALVAPETSAPLARVIDTLLRKLPGQRMQSAQAVREALQEG